MVTEEHDEEVGGSVLKQKAELETGAALEELVTQLAKPQAGVRVGPAEALVQLEKGEQAGRLVAFGQLPQPAQDPRVDRERSRQSAS